MIKEVLFRAVSKKGNWIYGFYYCHKGLDEHFILPIDETPFYNGIPIIPKAISDYEVYKETVSKFTGLTDKNRTKIFEGDIVELWCERSVYGRKQSVQDKYIKVRAVVEWGYQYSIGFMLNYNNEHNKKLCIAKNKEHYDRDIGKRCITDFLEKKKYIRHEIWKFLDDIEVIGNIHDNPELLEK